MSRVLVDSEKRITQNYGGNHRGIDLGWRADESQNQVYANCKGTVYAILDNIADGSEQGGGWGNYVLVQHPNGMFSRYAHLKTGLNVKKGQAVDENTVLGIMGSSGRAYGRHLHFEVQTGYDCSTRINPTEYLTKAIYEEPAPIPTPSTYKYEVGNKVFIKGALYLTSYDEKSNGYCEGKETIITRRNDGAPHPYNTTDDLGWMDEDSIRAIDNFDTTYTVQKGDTLTSIAKKFNTSWQKIYEDNKDIIGSNPNLIKPGQILVIK